MWKRKRRADGASDVVRARRFEVVDDAGRVRAVLGENSPPTATMTAVGLEVRDVEGHPRLAAVLTDFGPTLTIAAAGNIVAAFGHDDPHPEVVGAGAYLQLMSPDGAPVALWRVRADGSLQQELGTRG